MAVLMILCAGLVLAGIAENFRHSRRIERIPIRIHVNGTRGKSTTTRLIAAGLREGGFRVVAKATGTAPRLILEDGTERPVRRIGRANIIEQVRTAAMACARRADALVVECMALHPENLWVSEHRMVRATIGVITNVRDDHLDVMGPTIQDVAEALSLTIPRAGHLVTSESRFVEVFERRARTLHTRVHVVDGSIVPDEINESFPYLSFKDNVACALKVCELLGVDRETALRGMVRAQSDPGVTSILQLTRAGRTYVFVDAFAANDSASTRAIWRRFREKGSFPDVPVIAIMNNRADRLPRLAEMAALLAQEILPDCVVLVGEAGHIAERCLRRCLGGQRRLGRCWTKEGVSARIEAPWVRDLSALHDPGSVLQAVDAFAPDGAVLFGLGNTRGMGRKLTAYFEQNGEAARW